MDACQDKTFIEYNERADTSSWTRKAKNSTLCPITVREFTDLAMLIRLRSKIIFELLAIQDTGTYDKV